MRKRGAGRLIAFDVDERVGPRGRGPTRFIQSAVDLQPGCACDTRRIAWRAKGRPPDRRRSLACDLQCRRTRRSVDGAGSQKNASVSGSVCRYARLSSRPRHKERIVERVAGGSTARQDGDAEHALHGLAGARVHDVRVGDASGLERLLGAAGHRERPVFQWNGERRFSRIDRILNLDIPRVAARRRPEAVDRAAAGTDQGGSDVTPPKQVDDTIDGVALRDAAQIQFDAWPIESDRLLIAFKTTARATDAQPRVCELLVGRARGLHHGRSPTPSSTGRP